MAPTERVFLAADDVSTAKVFALTHPRHGARVQFMRTAEQLLEVQRFADAEPRSWLIAAEGGGDRVQQDGSFFLATPVDPLFFILPALLEARGTSADGPGYYKPLSDIICGDDAAPLQEHVCTLPGLVERLRSLCDVNDKYDEPMLRYNDAKTVTWLRGKAAAVRDFLASSQAAPTSAAAVDLSQFDEPVAAEGARRAEDCTLSALGFVSEYLGPQLQAKLCAAHGTTAEAVSATRSKPKRPTAERSEPASTTGTWAVDEESQVQTRPLQESTRPPADQPAAKKPKPAPVAKAAASAAPLKKGQKTMMGFFAKPK